MEENGELDHYIGVATTSNETADFDVLKIDDSTWAVFESIGPFPKHFKICGEGYTLSGFHLRDMRQSPALKFCGTRVQTLEILSIEAKFGFR